MTGKYCIHYAQFNYQHFIPALTIINIIGIITGVKDDLN